MYYAVDNEGKDCPFHMNDHTIVITKESIPNSGGYIEVWTDDFCVPCGSEGYYLVADVSSRGSHLCRFRNREEMERVYKQNLLPIFGVKIPGHSFLGIVESLKQNLYVVVGLKDNSYYLKLRFEITGYGAIEDIKIQIVDLGPEKSYSDMAAYYRNYQIEQGNCIPLKERILGNEYLRYAMGCPEIRIRMGWKPAPPKIMEQTVENEPDMHVACTFDRVKDLVDELSKQGVDRAQLCLVGWNVSGHDGRYPQIFPVEEKLGGEKKLRELISYAQKKGYQIVCHTNSTDCYHIAEYFSDDIVRKDDKGNLCVNDTPWSGGRMYHLCPTVAWEYASKDIPKVADLGFRGLHYVDVMSVVPLRECYDKKHPSNKKETLATYQKIMELCRDKIGGFSSEGAFDFTAEYLDYALYVTWADLDDDVFQEEIPLWELVYHGIILYNPSTTTVNCAIKGEGSIKKLFAYGGRPTFYYYSKFLKGGAHDDWLGKDDLIMSTEEQLKDSVAKIKEIYDKYQKVARLQTEYMVSYEETKEHGISVEYSDGTKLTY